jgi:hypothetical protein
LKRKLWLLNLVLAVVLILLGYVLRQHWREAHAHEQKVLQAKIPPAQPPNMPSRPMVQKLQPTSYTDVAMKMLFSRDRNPDVIPEPPKPPPPPPPVPPFPVAHGVMIWGDVPPAVILSAGAKGEQETYRVGDKVGEFEIASISDRQIVFTWDGKKFVKNISDLEVDDTDSSAPNQQQVQNTPAPAAAPPPVQATAPQIGPGGGQNIDQEGRTKTCDQNDPSPVGAIVDGYRKVAVPNPLAPNAHFCQWQAVN